MENLDDTYTHEHGIYPFVDHEPPFVAACMIRRKECGCGAMVGMRMDNGEDCFIIGSCADHISANERVAERLQTLPPSDIEMGLLYRGILEEEIARSSSAVKSTPKPLARLLRRLR